MYSPSVSSIYVGRMEILRILALSRFLSLLVSATKIVLRLVSNLSYRVWNVFLLCAVTFSSCDTSLCLETINEKFESRFRLRVLAFIFQMLTIASNSSFEVVIKNLPPPQVLHFEVSFSSLSTIFEW